MRALLKMLLKPSYIYLSIAFIEKWICFLVADIKVAVEEKQSGNRKQRVVEIRVNFL